MTGEQAGFIVGAGTAFLICIALSENMDLAFSHLEEKYKSSIERCEALGSTPKSVDESTVTCENSIEVDWR